MAVFIEHASVCCYQLSPVARSHVRDYPGNESFRSFGNGFSDWLHSMVPESFFTEVLMQSCIDYYEDVSVFNAET